MNSKHSHQNLIAYCLIGLIALGVGSYLRLYPLINYVSFEAEEQATMVVINNIRHKVIATVRKNFSNLSAKEQRQHIQKNFDQLIRSEKDEFRKTVRRIAREIDRKQNNQLYPYLLGSDSYYYLSLTKNIERHGSVSDQIKGSKYFNPMMLAPHGFWEPFNLHPYIGYWLYKFMSIFNPNTEMMYAVSFLPLVIAGLALIPFLMISLQLKCSPASALVGGIYFLSVNIFLKRSLFGWYDNDPYNVLFPLILLALLLYAIKQREDSKQSLIIGTLFALVFTLYAHFWHGWGFFLGLVLSVYVLLALGQKFFQKSGVGSRHLWGAFGLATIGSIVGISLSFGPGEFFILINEGWTALKNFLEPQFSIWPDIYIGVGELHRVPLSELLELSGGYLLWAMALMGLGVFVYRAFKHKNATQIYQALALIIFLSAMMILAKGALRFSLFAMVPVCVLFPLGVEALFGELRKLYDNWLPNYTYKKFVVSGLILLSAGILVVPRIIYMHNKIPSLIVRIYNSIWDSALEHVRNETPPDSIVNTWWPPGHFVKATAERSVTFDGATINFPQGYWIANILINQDELETLGILRMLNNSGNHAADFLLEQGWKHSRIVQTLKKIVRLNLTEAQKTLTTEGIDPKTITTLLELTHAKPPPTYLLIYNEMMDKNVQLKFIGGWNFKTIEEITSSPEKMSKIPPRRSPQYIQFLWDLVGGPYKYSGILDELGRDKASVIFEENVQINLANKDVTVNSKRFGQGKPFSIFYEKNGEIIEHKIPNGQLAYSVILINTGSGYNCALLDRRLARSTLASLFFFNAKNHKFIKPFVKREDLTGRTRIYVYEVDWEGFINNLETD